jgi:hypothetical protein
LKEKLTEFYYAVNSKLTLPEEAKEIIDSEELPLYKSVKKEL